MNQKFENISQSQMGKAYLTAGTGIGKTGKFFVDEKGLGLIKARMTALKLCAEVEKTMNKDMCVACDDGILNIRVGAIIMKDGKILMVGNDRDYLYSVGGRVKFGETAEEAVVREVLEETGVQMEIDRLGFVHENYFYGDMPSNRNKLIYEISLFFYMKVPDAFAPISESFMEDNSKEHLVWASLDEDIKMYPEFFKTELKNPTDTVKLFTTDKR